jgi:DNA-binding GntR family transcriptional regulator
MIEPSPAVAVDRRPDRSAVADWTLTKLHEMIFNGELQPGDVLTELDLTKRLGVSRSPVRDALRELEYSGLIDVDEVNGRRSLRAFGEDDIAESYDLRTELEALVARWAARSATPGQLDTIRLAFDRMKEVVTTEALDITLPVDFAFHRSIAVASGRPRPLHILAGVWIQHQALIRRMDRIGADPTTPEQRKQSVDDHERMCEAITSRDEAASEAAVRQHLQNRRTILMARFHERGLGSL